MQCVVLQSSEKCASMAQVRAVDASDARRERCSHRRRSRPGRPPFHTRCSSAARTRLISARFIRSNIGRLVLGNLTLRDKFPFIYTNAEIIIRIYMHFVIKNIAKFIQ